MNEQTPRTPQRDPGDSNWTEAEVHSRRPFNFIWIIPIVAALIAAFLGYRALNERGPTITISFKSADGLTAGQTHVQHKAVDLGIVRSIDLSQDMTHVEVRVEMRKQAARVLTDQARFWVVRPRFDAASISGLETLVSGAYIELDPGTPNGKQKLNFVGLEEPPAVRSDEPGHTFVLHTDRIGQLGSGSPVFYRDINVGELLGYQLNPHGRGVTIQAFIRAPYDGYVYKNTHFWNVSGASLDFGAQGVQLRIASLQALISGGVAFDVPPSSKPAEVSKPGAAFQLYGDKSEADAAGYRERIKAVTYIDGSVRGLAPGAPVELYGIQIGNVTGIELQLDPNGTSSRVAVRMELEPERVMPADQVDSHKAREVASNLVKRGMRVQLQSANIVTGQLLAALVFDPQAPAADVEMEGDTLVLPNIPGGLDSITSGLSDLVTKLERLPLDDIAKNLDDTLRGSSNLANGPELKQAMASLSATMGEVQTFVRTANAGMMPAVKRLPVIAQDLETGLNQATRLMGSVDAGYGDHSEFKRDMERLLDEVSDTARSVRLLSNYLDQHPEALIRGRDDSASTR